MHQLCLGLTVDGLAKVKRAWQYKNLKSLTNNVNLAQSGRHQIVKKRSQIPRVSGSIPTGGTVFTEITFSSLHKQYKSHIFNIVNFVYYEKTRFKRWDDTVM